MLELAAAADPAELVAEAERAVELALALGADGARATVRRARSAEFRGFEGRLEKAQESREHALSLALYAGGRYSTHATNDLEPERLERFLAGAVALTRAVEVDPHRALPDAELYAGRAQVELDLVDPALLSLCRERRSELCLELEEAARADPAVVSASTTVVDGVAQTAQVASNGLRGAHAHTWLWLGATVTVADGERRPEASRFVGGVHAADVPAARTVGREALARALARRGAQKLASRKTVLVTSPEAGAALLGRVFSALTAAAIERKQSFLAGRRGEKVASELFTIADDPLLARGSASRWFDAEGIAARPRTVAAGGVLETFFVDTYYGRKLGLAPNGGSPSNLVMRAGAGSGLELARGVASGLWVDAWLGGNANMTTGDFSFGFAGRRIEGGELAGAVSEMNVTGNYADLLGRLAAVGADAEPWSRVRTPSLVFEGVQVSGL